MFREERRKHSERLLETWKNGIWLVCVCVCVWVPCRLICQLPRLLKESCSSFGASRLFQLHTERLRQKRKARVTVLIGPTATENEFLLNAKVTITHPSSHLPPLLSLSPSSFVAGGRQTAEQPIAIRAAVCQAAFKWSPVSR